MHFCIAFGLVIALALGYRMVNMPKTPKAVPGFPESVVKIQPQQNAFIAVRHSPSMTNVPFFVALDGGR